MAYGGKISDILVRRNYIDSETLTSAEEEAKSSNVRLEKYLVENSYLPGHQMSLALAEYLNIPPIILNNFSPEPLLLEILSKDVLKKYHVLPITRVGKHLTVALADPFDLVALDELRTLTGLEITPLVANDKDIDDAITRLYADAAAQGLDMESLMRDEGDIEVNAGEGDEDQSLDEMIADADGAPVIRMVNMILLEAIRRGASDIHIEMMEKYIRLRYRVDGGLQESPAPPKNLQKRHHFAY